MSYTASISTIQILKVFIVNTGKSHMSESMLQVAKRVEPELAEKNPNSKDEIWQDRVQQWRNGFMKQAKANAEKNHREEGGMDVRDFSNLLRFLSLG